MFAGQTPGGHLTVFDGPGGGKWFSYRHEKLDRLRGTLCVDPFSVDAEGRVTAGEPSVGETPVPRAVVPGDR
jgi:hypothetical protein